MSINNKRSYTEYTVTQPTTDFAIGFDDFDEGGKDNILVTLNGVLVESLGYAAIRKNENTVSITPAITEGTVRLTRETDIDEPFHKFTAGALFSAKSMDENFQQVRNSQQEVRDGFVFLEYNTNGIVQASKEATAQAKAATVEATASAVRAETAADTAVQAVGSLQGVVDAATTATTKANAATATATTAASQATAATTSAQNATQAASTAKQEATAAAANANAATVDTLAATGRANDAAVVVEGLTTTVNSRVSAVEVSQEATIQRVDNFIATDVAPIVNDAINNTAVEGGVLADTFVTATAYGSGSIVRTQREVNAERVSVHDFGAIGDGTLHTVAEWIPSRFINLATIQAVYPKVTALTDSIDRVAIQACIDSCVVSGKIAEGVAGSKYCIDKQVDIVSNADFSCCKFIVANNFTGKVVSTSSRTLGKLLLRNLEITYPEVTNKSAAGDAHYGATGIYLEGVRNCNMTFNDIYGMETNLHLYSDKDGSYISYNNYYFEGLISRSKVNVLIEVVGDGWINQCQWWGGQFARYSQDTLANTTTCVKFRKADAAGNNAPNGHSFFGCSMEGAFTRTIDYDYDPLLKTTYFGVNRWVACRFEQAAMSRFNYYSLYDKLDGCYISLEMVFENDVTPNMDGCTRHFKSNIDVADLIGTTRSSTRTHRFSASNSANALALSVGTSSLINASITSGGAFGGYHPTQTGKLHPMINCGVIFGVPTISMGDGVAEASERIYRAAVGDWRLNFNLLPSTSETYNLGSITYKYNQVHAKQVHLSGSVGFFGTYPITTKPVVTGSTTDGTALASLIAALASYGLITNSTT